MITPAQNTIPAHNFIAIAGDAFAVSSLAEAVACWCAARDQYDWTASNAPMCFAQINGERIKISYNGRAWRADGSEVLP